MLDSAASSANVERDAESAQLVSVVHRALSRMPASQAGLLETFHLEDRPAAEIAKEAGMSERAVEGRLRRARQRLRRELASLLKIGDSR